MTNLLDISCFTSVIALNFGNFRVPLCIAQCFCFGWIWLNILAAPEPEITAHYKLGVLSICISCVIAMCIEPMEIVAQAFLFIKLRVLIDTFSISIRTILFTLLVLWKPDKAVVAFSIAQVTCLICHAAAYCYYFNYYMKKNDEDFPFKSLKDFLPSRLPSQSFVDWKLCILTWSFLKQGILKQILTEGERYVMTLLDVLTFYEQGIYDVVNNLGSLAARFLFRPIEDSAYFYFSQMIHRDKDIKEQNKMQMTEAAQVLRQLLRCVISIGVVVVCFGQSYSKLLLLFYGGNKLADSLATLLLRTHCLAVVFLALNGTTECYALATMDASQIDRYNHTMAYLSVGFLLASWILTKLFGSVGFIMANCCNMGARIFHSVKFINKRYQGTDYKPLNGIMPNTAFLIAAFSSGLVTKISELYYYDDSKLIHLSIGTVCFAITVLVWFYCELDLVKIGYQRYRKQSSVKAD